MNLSSLSSLSSLRRGVALVAAPALALSALTTLSPAPATAVVDPGPVADGAAWLASQLTDGVIRNDQFDFDDLGLSVDTGLAMAELGRDDTVDTISTALAPQVATYYSYEVATGKTHVSAGSLAKAAAFAQDAGDDATAYGGQDLLAQLEDRVSTEPASAGRITDVFFPEEPFESDFSNVIGQAFAAEALDTAGSTSTNAVTEYLLAQQCSEGFFRQDLGATAAADCDSDAAAAANTDATALAAINLLGQSDDTEVGAALELAASWLVGAQRPDGSFGSDELIPAGNANSTGLAGWALGELGRDAAAEKAAVWLRGRQLVNTASCAPYAAADEGAIAYDDAALRAAAAGPIPVELQDQFRRGTAQALPGLRHAPNGVTSEVTSTAGFVRAGSAQRIVVDASPGDLVCAVRTGGAGRTARVPAGGRVALRVTMPKGTTTISYRVQDGDEGLGTVAYSVLGRTSLRVNVPRAVGRGDRVVVRVSGLAVGERATFRVRGVKRGTDVADRGGRAALTLRLQGRPGRVKVAVTGAFADLRSGAAAIRLTR